MAAACCAADLAHADTEISTVLSTAQNTTTDGNITIDASGSTTSSGATSTGGGVVISTASAAAVILNSNNYVINSGTISNNGVADGIAAEIDTSAGNIDSPVDGFANTGQISAIGAGTGKIAFLISGGHTFFGPLNFTTITATALTGATEVTQASTLSVKGDGSSVFYLVQGTTVDSGILFQGSITQVPSDTTTQTGAVAMNFDGVVNGNVIADATFQGVGRGLRGFQLIGGIHSCASDAANQPSDFTCPTGAVGAFINNGSISLTGVSIKSTKVVNAESGSAIVIGNSIDGGFINTGPATASAVTAAVISANGVTSAPTILIDPYQSVTSTQTVVRGPIVIGEVGALVDSADPTYSFINRGTISAQPIDAQVSSAAIEIEGYTQAIPTTLTGGFLNTGTISAVATTNQQTISASPEAGLSRNVSASALDIGAWANIPTIDVLAQAVNNSTNTPASITASITGIGQGTADAIFIDKNATVPTINVSQYATVAASVATTTINPDPSIATTSSPFTLISEAIIDDSGSLGTINNGGVIQAVNSTLTVQPNADVISTQNALDLQNTSRTTGIVVNNSGKILGDVLFGAVTNNDVLNVGNTGSGGAANPATGLVDTPSYYAVVAENITSEISGSAPATTTSIINFGSGTGNELNVGSFGYVNSIIYAAPGGLDVTVANNGTLFVANTATTGSVNAHDFDINGGTLGLTISQNTSSSTPVVRATEEATIASGANVALQFGGFVSSGTTSASVNNPAPQVITLISAPTVSDPGLAGENAVLSQDIPFLFQPTSTPLSLSGTAGAGQNLLLTLTPRAPGLTGPNGVAGLGLSGDALAQFPFAASALATDDQLGAAVASSITVYNTPGVPASGINVAASQQAGPEGVLAILRPTFRAAPARSPSC